MYMSNHDVNKMKHQIAHAHSDANDRLMDEVEAAIKWLEEVAVARSKTNDSSLFVNEFYQWSRANPPKPPERVWMSTPEVMELQWARWVRQLILTTGATSREPEQQCLP